MWRRSLRRLLELAIALPALAWLWVIAVRWRNRTRADFVWGCEALINSRYYARAVAATGKNAYTLIDTRPQRIFSGADFDLAFDDLAPRYLRGTPLWSLLRFYWAMAHLLRRASVFHISYTGGPLRATPLRWLEAHLLRTAGVRTVVTSFGSDFWRYSKILDGRVKQAMMINYKAMGRLEDDVDRQVRYWVRHADVVLGTTSTDGLGYWDCMVSNPVCVDVENWPERATWSEADGLNASVKIVHAPNHRGVKGTEFFLDAVERIRSEGLKLDFVLLEDMPNDMVLGHLQSADIALDQCASGMGYGLFAIESMAAGAVVVGNLEDAYRMDLHRQYCYVGECPLVSSDADSVLATIRRLVTDPRLRRELGAMGREFTLRYHSTRAAQHYFGLIHRKLLSEPELDIAVPFHPLLSSYSRQWPQLAPPLVRNRLPELAR